MLRAIVISTLISIICADVQVKPYPPSGWKPKGAPFTLPSQFLPTAQQNVQVEITQENVELAGQLNEITTVRSTPTNFPGSKYLPPTDVPDDVTDETSTDDYLRVQGLPKTNNNFGINNQNQSRNRKQNNVKQDNQKDFANNAQNQNSFGRLRVSNSQKQFSSNQQFTSNQQLANQQFNSNAQFGKQVIRPAPVKPNDAEQNPASANSNVNDSDDDNENENENQNNSNTFAGNGQYYILTPDNTLQRVTFMTSQNEDEARTNGFTAQLQYMPVEPIRDPIYLYNQEGQFVRVFK